jgi:hypothetical protein
MLDPSTDEPDQHHFEVEGKTYTIWDPGYSRKIMYDALSLAPLVVYRALKEKYGRPNQGFDEWKSQWCYRVKGSRSSIRINDWKLLHWLLEIIPDSDVRKEDNKSVIDRDCAEFLSWLKTATQGSKIAKDTNKHLFILNGFRSLYSNAEFFLRQYEDNPADYDEENPLFWAAAVSFVLSAEALLNLVFELYLNQRFSRIRTW